MPKISAVIITFNEEDYIGRCLESLADVADEIIVVDSFSTDRTREICEKHNVRFFLHAFEGYVEQKNHALGLASHSFILSLDADEALGNDLKKSILEVKDNPGHDGYTFNRLNNYCGKWIHHSRWYPDRQLRLFFREKGSWKGYNPHDKFRMNEGTRVKHLEGDLLHWNYASCEEHRQKMERFSSISAESYFRAGRKAWPFSGTIHMIWSFFRSYVLYLGFLDGYTCLVACSITARGSYLKYNKLRKLHKKTRVANGQGI
ncbi:MAG: glycosyltransferase family 2 protein [Bacteroidales bacterium]